MQETPRSERRQTWIDVWIVLGFALSFTLPVLTGSVPTESRLANSVLTLGYNLPICSVILYLMWRSEMAWEHFGLRRFFDADSVGTFLAALIATAGVSPFIAMGLDRIWMPTETEVYRIEMAVRTPVGGGEWIAFLPSMFVLVAVDELVFRGFLTVRLHDLLGKKLLAVVIPAILSGLISLYLGVSACLAVTIVGMILGAMMLSMRRLGSLIIARFIAAILIVFFPEAYRVLG